MKLLAKDLKTTIYPTGGVGISFDTSNVAKEDIQTLKRGDYVVTITKPKDKRSLNQNNYMWEIIGQISKKQNGNYSDNLDIYCQILEMAGAKYFNVRIPTKNVDDLRKKYRAVKIISHNHDNDTVFCQVFIGTSEMDVSEMNTVIDKTLEYAYEVGIDTEYWEALLKEDNNGQPS